MVIKINVLTYMVLLIIKFSEMVHFSLIYEVLTTYLDRLDTQVGPLTSVVRDWMPLSLLFALFVRSGILYFI